MPQDTFPRRPHALELIYMKFNAYRYQAEYRVALMFENDPSPAERHLVTLGSLADLCAVV